jgi:CheY-like chemotaxis protein
LNLGMKELTTDQIRLEINRLGALVVETALFHPSGVKLHSAGQPLTLAHARFLHDSGIMKLYMLEFGEDERTARRSLGVEMVLAAKVVPGDELAEDIRTPAGDLVLGAGTTVEPSMLDRIRTASILAVRIRHRKLATLMKEAEGYLTINKEPTVGFKEPVTRIMRLASAAAAPVRYLLIPQARVLVGVADDLMRTLLLNALTSEGHETVERKSAALAVEDAHVVRPHILLLDLAEALPVLPRIRGAEGLRSLTVLVSAEANKTSEIQSALYEGANDWIPRPASRDLLSDRIKGCQDILLRKVEMTPSLGDERRRHPRQETKGECGLRDPAQTRLLAVSTGEIVDEGEGGLRLSYNVPRWPCPWAYSTHGVHPRHPFFPYAASNPMGRELRVVFPGPGGAAIERPARVVHLVPEVDDLEVMGLSFARPSDPPRPSTTRKF